MKHLFFSVLCLATALVANGQMGIYSLDQERATAVDTALYKVTYSLDYTWSPEIGNRFDDVRTVLIGRHHVKDFSDVICHYDSLMTADMRRGADAFSNPNGTPWPLEILISPKKQLSEMKYRLPCGMGVLNYTDSIEPMRWEFVPDTISSILGYECQQATLDYAGRHYMAWFTSELPLPYGPYKFGGLPGLILRLQDNEGQFIWEAKGFEKSDAPILTYCYEGERNCTPEEASKTIARIFKAPIATHMAAMGGGKGRVYIVGPDGKTRDATDVEETPIPYKPLEIK